MLIIYLELISITDNETLSNLSDTYRDKYTYMITFIEIVNKQTQIHHKHCKTLLSTLIAQNLAIRITNFDLTLG